MITNELLVLGEMLKLAATIETDAARGSRMTENMKLYARMNQPGYKSTPRNAPKKLNLKPEGSMLRGDAKTVLSSLLKRAAPNAAMRKAMPWMKPKGKTLEVWNDYLKNLTEEAEKLGLG